MTRFAFAALAAAALLGGPARAQIADPVGPGPDPAKRLPDGKSRDLAIAKREHEKSLEEVAEIRRLAEELEAELKAQTAHVVSMDSLRKAEQIETLAKRLQGRMKRR